MRVEALGNQIARTDIEKEAAEQRERDAEAIGRHGPQPGCGDADGRVDMAAFGLVIANQTAGASGPLASAGDEQDARGRAAGSAAEPTPRTSAQR